MPAVSKVTETLFESIKDELQHVDPTTAAMKNHLSMKTILMIKGSASYSDYEAQKRAQHPPSKQPPLRDMLTSMDSKLNTLLIRSQENRLF